LRVLGLASMAAAMELTPENWDDATAGKTVFIKFFAPWCGHCKAMKPAWDKLIAEYEDSKTALVADVDCTAEGKDLCETHGVQGFPTLKWGDPSALEDYEGGRDLAELKTFAEDNLKPLCSPTSIDLCDDEKKKQINEMMALADADLSEKIETAEKEMKDVETWFQAEVQKLQETYEGLEKEKTEKTTNIKNSGLGLMKAVKAAKGKAKTEL